MRRALHELLGQIERTRRQARLVRLLETVPGENAARLADRQTLPREGWLVIGASDSHEPADNVRIIRYQGVSDVRPWQGQRAGSDVTFEQTRELEVECVQLPNSALHVWGKNPNHAVAVLDRDRVLFVTGDSAMKHDDPNQTSFVVGYPEEASSVMPYARYEQYADDPRVICGILRAHGRATGLSGQAVEQMVGAVCERWGDELPYSPPEPQIGLIQRIGSLLIHT